MLILIGHRNVPTIGYQINCLTLSELFVINGKRELNNAVDIIFPAICEQQSQLLEAQRSNLQSPSQITMEFLVDTFHVLEGDLLP